jgi:NADH:ubiquinone oxidoreductase subunit 3 (subunit A)
MSKGIVYVHLFIVLLLIIILLLIWSRSLHVIGLILFVEIINTYFDIIFSNLCKDLYSKFSDSVVIS